MGRRRFSHWQYWKGAKVADRVGKFGLGEQGMVTPAQLHWNLTTAPLVEHSVQREEGLLGKHGPLVVRTGKHTGRSAQDKFTVRDELTDNTVWWGKTNKPMDPAAFDRLHQDFLGALGQKDKLFVQDLYGGSQPEHRVRVRVINELAWHSLFIRTLLAAPKLTSCRFRARIYDHRPAELPRRSRAPRLPERDGDRGQLTEKLILIGGTAYAGEMKKSVFGLLNYYLPANGVMPMHCSANIGPEGDTAVFFGLSGTGKTTLSADPNRTLIGDDEHGWSDHGGLQFRRRLLRQDDPPVGRGRAGDLRHHQRFGTVLENVVIDPDTRELDSTTSLDREQPRRLSDRLHPQFLR
jgi:phosphoenolpyruvate carboxykinase (ATP)